MRVSQCIGIYASELSLQAWAPLFLQTRDNGKPGPSFPKNSELQFPLYPLPDWESFKDNHPISSSTVFPEPQTGPDT